MKENMVAKVLFIIGIAFIVIGFILGLNAGSVVRDYGFGHETTMVWSVFFSYFFGGIVSGMLFIGISEIIKLLHSINHEVGFAKYGKLTANSNKNSVREPSPSQTSVGWTPSNTDKEKIHELYANEKITDIIASNMEGYCIVKLDMNDEQHTRIVDVGGFGAADVGETSAIGEKVLAWYYKNN